MVCCGSFLVNFISYLMMRKVDGDKCGSQQLKDGLLPQLVGELSPKSMSHGLVHLQVDGHCLQTFRKVISGAHIKYIVIQIKQLL